MKKDCLTTKPKRPMTHTKKNCADCHSRHFKSTKRCQCGSEFFECDAIVVSKYHFKNATGADIRRLMIRDNYTISNKAVLDAMLHLGYKNIRAQYADKQEDVRAYLKTLKKPPRTQSIIDKFGVHARTAKQLIQEPFPDIKVQMGEEEILQGYLDKYNKFISKPKAEQFPIHPDMIGIIYTLKRYKMI